MSGKFMIGTAQFDEKYGLTNKTKKFKKKEIINLLKFARKNKIKFIDTAQRYGKSESNLKFLKSQKWNIVTKIDISKFRKNKNKKKIKEKIKKKFSVAEKKLGKKNLYGVLTQNSDIIFNDKDKNIYNSLISLKKEGFIKRFGYSIYNFKNIEKICKEYKPDIIQCPFNIFDRRLIEKKNLNLLKKSKIEVHIRSVFLQVLLLSSEKSIINKFSKFKKKLKNWENFIRQKKISKLQACLNFVSHVRGINKIIIGVDNLNQLKQIINSKKIKKINFPKNLKSNNLNLINPTLWKK